VILYQLDTADIDSLEVTEVITNYASTVDLDMDVTDRLGVNVYAVTDHSSNVVVNFVYQGIDHASYVDSGFFDCTAPITPTIPNLPAAEPDPLGILIGYIPLAIIVAVIIIFVRVTW